MGLREGKILAIERSWIKKREGGYWLCLPQAASRIKGNPKEVPLNRIALRALNDDLPSMTDGRVFGIGLMPVHSNSIGSRLLDGSASRIFAFTISAIPSPPAYNDSAWIMSCVRHCSVTACQA